MIILNSTTLEKSSEISDIELKSLSHGYLTGNYDSTAQTTLKKLKINKQFLLCECNQNINNPPLLGVRRLPTGGLILANLPGRMDHNKGCLFSYQKTKGINDNPKQSYNAVVEKNDNGYIKINEITVKQLYRKLLHNSQLNIINPSKWDIKVFEQNLIDAARLSSELVELGLSKKIHFGYQSITRSKDALKDLDHGDYQVCFNLISDYDNRSFNLSFNKDNPFWVDAGRLFVNATTSKGPYIATTILAKYNKNIVTIGSYIEPVLSKWLPIPIPGQTHRELAFEIVGKNGLFSEEHYHNGSYCLELPLFEVRSSISDTPLKPAMIIKGKQGTAVIGDPSPQERPEYNEIGTLIWFRDLPFYSSKRMEKLQSLSEKIKSVI